jgi:hypothetical protein
MIQNAEPDTFAGKSSDRIANLEGEISSNLFGVAAASVHFPTTGLLSRKTPPSSRTQPYILDCRPSKTFCQTFPHLRRYTPSPAIFRHSCGETWQKCGTLLPSAETQGSYFPAHPPSAGIFPCFPPGIVSILFFIFLSVSSVSRWLNSFVFNWHLETGNWQLSGES